MEPFTKNCTVEVETPESVSLLVPVSGGIKDSVTVKRDLIESHQEGDS